MTASPSMTAPGRSSRDHDAWSRAVVSRDPRFDGVFYVGISTTGIYCRPVCPARISDPERRRFFASAAAAEQEGFRPCLRCRPELAPGLAVCDAVPRVARAAATRIAAGGLNGRSVADLLRLGYPALVLDLPTAHALALGLACIALPAVLMLSLTHAARAR